MLGDRGGGSLIVLNVLLSKQIPNKRIFVVFLLAGVVFKAKLQIEVPLLENA